MNRVVIFSAVALLIFAGCSTRGPGAYRSTNNTPVHEYVDDSSAYASKPAKKNYSNATMRPYVVHGKRYHPTVVNVVIDFMVLLAGMVLTSMENLHQMVSTTTCGI